MRRIVELFLLVGFSLLLSLLLGRRTEQLHLTSNEAQAIGDTRTIVSANQTYASANCGLYARTLECMARDSEGGICIPGYPEDAPEFLGSDLARAVPYVKSGYERNYTTADAADEVPAGRDPGSPRFFCYASRPVSLGLTGDRSFLGAATGELYFDYDGDDTNCVPVARTESFAESAPTTPNRLSGGCAASRQLAKNRSSVVSPGRTGIRVFLAGLPRDVRFLPRLRRLATRPLNHQPSLRFARRNRKDWGWASRSRARSWKRMAARFGRRTTPDRGASVHFSWPVETSG